MFRKIFAFVFVLSIGASAVWAQTLDGCPSINPYELGTGNTEVYRDCANINDGVTFVANAVATAASADDYTVIDAVDVSVLIAEVFHRA